MRQERIASFQRTLDTCHSQASALEASIAAIWQGIFSARFRDVDADIRATVICGIGEWMSLNPADFLNDNYLKYVAWALSDRVSTDCSKTTSGVYYQPNFDDPHWTDSVRGEPQMLAALGLEAWACPGVRCSDGIMSACRIPTRPLTMKIVRAASAAGDLAACAQVVQDC